MKNPRQKYPFYRIVSLVILVALVFLVRHDLNRTINPLPFSSSTESQQITPPDINLFSPDIAFSNDGILNDLDYTDKPTVPIYQSPKIFEPNIQKNLYFSGIKVKKIKLKKPEKSDKESNLVQQKQSDTDIFLDLPEFANNVGFNWVANNQRVATSFNVKQQNHLKLLPNIAQINNKIDYNEQGQNNKFDDQIAGSFGNRRIVTHIGNFNYTNQTLYNTFYSYFLVRSIGDYNTSIQNVFNAYNARLDVIQNGSNNRVRQDVYSRTPFGTFNSTVNEVRQIGSYNLFSSQQVGISNTIEAIQLGNFNNVDITQEGNNNSAEVRQSGTGNTVTIEQN